MAYLEQNWILKINACLITCNGSNVLEKKVKFITVVNTVKQPWMLNTVKQTNVFNIKFRKV